LLRIMPTQKIKPWTHMKLLKISWTNKISINYSINQKKKKKLETIPILHILIHNGDISMLKILQIL
jgi:hypothetical protein